MSISQRQFRGFTARYHRNGIAGQSFFLCAWYDLSERIHLNAVVFENAAHTAVFNPQDLNDRYRGDNYATPLREAIQALERAQPECLYGGPKGGAK